jgi:hypothetical protein
MTDQPTRRLTDPTPDAGGNRCPKCHGPQVHARSSGYVELLSDSLLRGIFGRTQCAAWVCSQCGYVEWYATNPEKLGS